MEILQMRAPADIDLTDEAVRDEIAVISGDSAVIISEKTGLIQVCIHDIDAVKKAVIQQGLEQKGFAVVSRTQGLISMLRKSVASIL